MTWFDHLFSLFPSYRAIIRGLMRRTPAVRSSNGLSFRSLGLPRSRQPLTVSGTRGLRVLTIPGRSYPSSARRLLDRPQFLRLLNQFRAGDVVVVWKLDRLSRSLRDVLTIMEQLGEAGAGFRSLTEAVDTTTAAGRMMMQMVGAFAEFERAMLRERHSGRGRYHPSGRPRRGMPPQALPATAIRDSKDGFRRREDRYRRRSPNRFGQSLSTVANTGFCHFSRNFQT